MHKGNFDNGQIRAIEALLEDGVPAVQTEELRNARQWTDYYIPNYASGDGTEDNPWVDGWNAAMDDIPKGHADDDVLARLVAPAGHYELTKAVQMKKGIRRRKALSDPNEENVMPFIKGAGRYSTTIDLADGVDDHMFIYDKSEVVDADENICGGGMADLTLNGYKTNQASDSGDCVHIAPQSDGTIFIQSVWRDLFLRRASSSIWACRGDDIGEIEWRNVTFNRPEAGSAVEIGTDTAIGGRLVFSECKFIFANNGQHGIDINAAQGEVTFQGCRFRNNSGCGSQANGDSIQFVGCEWVVDTADATGTSQDKPLINNRANNIRYHGTVNGGGEITDGVQIQNGDDVDLDLQITGVTNEVGSDGGTRTRWKGVIGGGPIGGVDLSSTTGQYLGDRAIADGTSAATTGALARWSGSEWEYHDPAGTV